MRSHRALLICLNVCLFGGAANAAQEEVLQSNEPVVQTRKGDDAPRPWRLSAELDPDVYAVALDDGETETVCFISDVSDLCFDVRSGDQRDFAIVYDGVRYNTRIIAVPPAAVFTDAYQAAHRGKVEAVSPEVYELVNIAWALTEFSDKNAGFAAESKYLDRVRRRFAPWKDHPFVQALQTAIRDRYVNYHLHKMNAIAFDFDDEGRLVKSPVYDRAAFLGAPHNSLEPLLPEMQSFADMSDFRKFYRSQRRFYADQVEFIEDELGAPEMWRWLKSEFPGVEVYDSVKIVFSPLVGYSQSSSFFEYRGYRELQPHVNFPYWRRKDLAKKSEAIWRGHILFTELNHGFINPEAAKYLDEINTIFADPKIFVSDLAMQAGYGNAFSIFAEYLNWVLIDLYNADHMPKADYERTVPDVARMMRDRGFIKFAEFSDFVNARYASRTEDETIADLYPEFIDWFRQAAR